MSERDAERLWGTLWKTAFPPDHFDRMRRVEAAITGDGRPRVDRAFGTLAIESMGVGDPVQIAAPDGSGYDTMEDYLATIAPGGVVPIAAGGTNATTAAAARANLGAAAVPLFGTTTIDVGSIAAGTCAAITFTVSGAAVGDGVIVAAPAAPEAGLIWAGRVFSANTVSIRLCNVTAAAIDPASATWGAFVVKP